MTIQKLIKPDYIRSQPHEDAVAYAKRLTSARTALLQQQQVLDERIEAGKGCDLDEALLSRVNAKLREIKQGADNFVRNNSGISIDKAAEFSDMDEFHSSKNGRTEDKRVVLPGHKRVRRSLRGLGLTR